VAPVQILALIVRDIKETLVINVFLIILMMVSKQIVDVKTKIKLLFKFY
jgi:hypothetical protein